MNETQPDKVPYDDGLEWLRQIRRDMLAEAGNDLGEYVRRIRENGKKYPNRVIPAPPPPADFEERLARALACAPGALESEQPEQASAMVAEEPPATIG